MAFILGLDCKLYRNTGTWEEPSWTEVENIKDLSCNLEKGEFDATLRASGGVREFLGTLKDWSIEFGMKWDPQNDPDCDAFLSVYLDEETSSDVLVLDGSIDTSGSQGIRFEADVFNFTRNEALEEGVMVDASLKPNAERTENHVPYYYEVGLSSSGT